MKLITETIKSKLIEEQEKYAPNTYTYYLIEGLTKLCNDLKSQELQNIEAALRHGYFMPDRWKLELEVYDHIKMRYDEEAFSYDEYHEKLKSYEFFKKNFTDTLSQEAELQECNCGEADRCNCHLVDDTSRYNTK